MVKIDKEACIGCGSCVAVCDSVFEMDGMKAKVKKGQEKSTSPCVKEAIETCPTSAIKN